MSGLKHVNIKDDLGVTIQALNDNAGQNNLHFSKDFVLKKTGHGTIIGVNPRITYEIDAMRYKGEYNTTSSYAVYDVVRVLSGSNYNINGNVVSASIGTWICVAPIPAFNYTSSQQYDMRQAGINYAPLYPESSSLANPYLTGNAAIGRYWEMLASTGSNATGSSSVSSTIEVYYSASFGDYWLCAPTSGSGTPSTFVRVAKPSPLRNSITSENIYGNSYNYSYPISWGNHLYGLVRYSTRSYDGNTELQIVNPEPQTNLYTITAMPLSTSVPIDAHDTFSGSVSSSISVNYIDVGNSYAWMQSLATLAQLS